MAVVTVVTVMAVMAGITVGTATKVMDMADTATFMLIGMDMVGTATATVMLVGMDTEIGTGTATGGMVAGGHMALAHAGEWCRVVGSGFATDSVKGRR